MDQFHAAVEVFDEGGAGFNPVAAVEIGEVVDFANFGFVDVAADDAIGPVAAGLAHHGLFVVDDKADDVFHAAFDVGREGPFRKAESAADSVEETADVNHEVISVVAEDGEPGRVVDDAIELISVQDPEAASVGCFVHGVGQDDDAAEGESCEFVKKFVVVSGNADHTGALAHFAQEFLDHIVVGLGPVPGAFERPAIEDVAHEIPVVGIVVLEKVEELMGLAGAPPEVEVGNPDGPVALGGERGGHSGLGRAKGLGRH